MNSPARLVAIHQPNFFPWVGFFSKIEHCDVFVLLDNVQYPKESWVNRVRILANGAPAWATVPVSRAGGSFRRIDEMRIDDSRPWREKLVRTLEMSYRRAPCFAEVFPVVSGVLLAPCERVVELNVAAIRAVLELMEIPAGKLVPASGVRAEGTSTELLINLVRAVGGGAYLTGSGAAAYQDEERFAAEGVALMYQRFTPLEYPQRGAASFVPGLSILDALFHVGPAATRALVRAVSSPQPAAAVR